jgi:hypothetical protein
MVQTMIGWTAIEDFGGEVTHWQPLPAPPLPTESESAKGEA